MRSKAMAIAAIGIALAACAELPEYVPPPGTIIVYQSPGEIAEFGRTLGRTGRVQAYSIAVPNACLIVLPDVSPAYRCLLAHEIRHCREGDWHHGREEGC